MQFCRLLLLIFICIILQSCTSAKVSYEVQSGKMSFNDGDYKQAFRKLLPPAANGNAQAEYAVGYMYYYGFGVSRDADTGIFWMNKAAAQNYAPAIKALRLINNRAVVKTEYREERQPRPSPVVEPRIQHGNDSAENTSDPLLKSLQEPAPPRQHARKTYRDYLRARIEKTNLAEKRGAPIEKTKVAEKRAEPVEKIEIAEKRTAIIEKKKVALKHVVPMEKPKVAEKHKTPTEKTMAAKKHMPPKSVAVSAPVPKKAAVHVEASAHKYALQLFGAYDLQDVKNVQRELKLQKSSYIWHTEHKGKDWYVLTYGSYATASDAKSAHQNLPEKAQSLNPWVRNVSGLAAIG